MSFNEYWNTRGERFLADNNKIPNVKDRAENAYAAGLADGIELSLKFDPQPNTAMIQDLNDLIDYHTNKANSFRGSIRHNHWEPGDKDKYYFHIRSLELLKKLKDDLEK